jgi:hypothetical protein
MAIYNYLLKRPDGFTTRIESTETIQKLKVLRLLKAPDDRIEGDQILIHDDRAFETWKVVDTSTDFIEESRGRIVQITVLEIERVPDESDTPVLALV